MARLDEDKRRLKDKYKHKLKLSAIREDDPMEQEDGEVTKYYYKNSVDRDDDSEMLDSLRPGSVRSKRAKANQDQDRAASQ